MGKTNAKLLTINVNIAALKAGFFVLAKKRINLTDVNEGILAVIFFLQIVLLASNSAHNQSGIEEINES